MNTRSLSLSKTSLTESFTPTATGLLQRKCASCGQHTIAGGECAECGKKKQLLQRRTANQAETAEVPAIVHDVLRSPGQSLDEGTRTFMESRFGHDFSGVRVHTDGKAAQSAQAVNALAYTVGRDVVFGTGQYAPGTSGGKRLLAHELTHVVQQQSSHAMQGQAIVGSPEANFEREADSVAAQVLRGKNVRVKQLLTGSSVENLQRDLATEPPLVPAPAQPDLTEEQIQQAIDFNRTRYNEANTRLIQDLLGGPITGVWTEENILAIAATQEEFNLTKDGKVGDATFRFLNREQTLEGMSTNTANCLTSFRVVGPDASTFRRLTPTQCRLAGLFRTESQFSRRCNCSQFQYRQFIRGHFRRNRGGVVTDISGWFGRLPSGSLTPGFQEDGDTTDVPINYGHRDQPADADPVDHYIDDAGADNQANGCRYRNEDSPGGDLDDCLPGDSYDIDVNFRGEIQRNGTPIQTKFWTAIHHNNLRP